MPRRGGASRFRLLRDGSALHDWRQVPISALAAIRDSHSFYHGPGTIYSTTQQRRIPVSLYLSEQSTESSREKYQLFGGSEAGEIGDANLFAAVRNDTAFALEVKELKLLRARHVVSIGRFSTGSLLHQHSGEAMHDQN